MSPSERNRTRTLRALFAAVEMFVPTVAPAHVSVAVSNVLTRIVAVAVK